MDRISAARERLEAVKSLAGEALDSGPPCSDCRYRTFTAMCGNPAYSDFSFEPSTARVSEVFKVPITKARSADGLCGPEAILFEPHEVPAVVAKSLLSGAGAAWLTFTVALFCLTLLLLATGYRL